MSITETDFKKAFLTGSRAYGTPRPDSDVDLVVMVSQADLVELARLDDKKSWRPDMKSASLRFGNLNIVAVTNEKLYDAWERVTLDLIAKKPVDRETAKAAFIAEIGLMYQQ